MHFDMSAGRGSTAFLLYTAIETCVSTVQEEGFFKLWNGITPAILRHVGE